MDVASPLLPRYVNGGCLTRRDQALALFAPRLPGWLNAARVARHVRRGAGAPPAAAGRPETITIPAYQGANAAALRMRDYLEARLARDIVAALVHGSIATGEEIPYSDFDALVILREELFDDARRLAAAAGRIERARAFMIDADPLQHHGWFVLAEHQLAAYPESYLPVAALRHARALAPAGGVRLRVVPVRDRRSDVAALEATSRRIASRIAAHALPRNVFDLKALLSEFMLLPALYVQARDGAGVFKRDSFARARGDFDGELWRVMDDVSDIRATWSVAMTGTQRRLLRARGRLLRRMLRRFAPAPPPQLAARLTGDFYLRMQRLAMAFPAALQERAPLHGAS